MKKPKEDKWDLDKGLIKFLHVIANNMIEELKIKSHKQIIGYDYNEDCYVYVIDRDVRIVLTDITRTTITLGVIIDNGTIKITSYHRNMMRNNPSYYFATVVRGMLQTVSKELNKVNTTKNNVNLLV